MRPLPALTMILALLMLASTVQAQSIDEPGVVNKFLGDFTTPSIVPGQSGSFSLTVNHPDAQNLPSPMGNVTLLASVYRYVTAEGSRGVSAGDGEAWPVIRESGGQEITVYCGDIRPGGSSPVEFTIDTGKSTPHGSYFGQSTYLVRFRLAFSYLGENFTFASRGYFTDGEWAQLAGTGKDVSGINRTYLKELGYDGIIPDSAFSVRSPIPSWPRYLLAGLAGMFAFLAFASHVLDNPGRYPRLEPTLLRLRGRCRTCWRGLRKRHARRGRR